LGGARGRSRCAPRPGCGRPAAEVESTAVGGSAACRRASGRGRRRRAATALRGAARSPPRGSAAGRRAAAWLPGAAEAHPRRPEAPGAPPRAQDLFQAHFDLPAGAPAGEPSAFGLCWRLYVVAKARLLPPFPNLVASFNLLVCVVAAAHAHVPAERLRACSGAGAGAEPAAAHTPGAGAPAAGGGGGGGGSGGGGALARLAAANKVAEAELRPLAGRLDVLMAELLPDLARGAGAGAPQPSASACRGTGTGTALLDVRGAREACCPTRRARSAMASASCMKRHGQLVCVAVPSP